MSHAQTVMLVDDDPKLLAALRRALHFEPYDLLLAETTSAALWLLATRPIDVLVSDQCMPGMSGTAFLAKVRAEHPHVISIMLTGHADLSTAISAINAGEVYRFFTKPCDAGSLAMAIRHALQQKALIRQARRLLETVRRQGLALAPELDGMADAAAPAVLYETDGAPEDLDALLREIQEELDAGDRRPVVRSGTRPGTRPGTVE